MLNIKKSKILIVLPDKYLSDFITDFYKYLLVILSTVLKFAKIITTSQFDPNDQFDVLVVVSMAHWPASHIKKLLYVPASANVICWHDDLFWINDTAKLVNEKIFEQASVILHGSRDSYLALWSQYKNKSHWLPLFAPPYFYQEYNPKPTPRSLLSGQCVEKLYPLRYHIQQHKSHLIDQIYHPNYQADDANFVRNKYAQTLNSYFCCVTDSGKAYGACRYNIYGDERQFKKHIDDYLLEKMDNQTLFMFKKQGQVLLKYFEIPAAGSLLIADDCTQEMKSLGFEPHVNYVPINETNAIDTINDCCKNPEKYEKIRHAGWLMSKTHTIDKRKEQLKNIFGSINVKV